jgi:hypothetical protein
MHELGHGVVVVVVVVLEVVDDVVELVVVDPVGVPEQVNVAT